MSVEALEYLFEAAVASGEGVTFSQDVLLALFSFLRSYAKGKSSKAIKSARTVIEGIYGISATLKTADVPVVTHRTDMNHVEVALPAVETVGSSRSPDQLLIQTDDMGSG